VARSLQAIRSISQAVLDAEIQDVVTGFGLLNEPYADCDQAHYRDFIQAGFDVVRDTLGPDTAVYVSDMFQEKLFNDGHWWLESRTYQNTFLDSHFYQVFDQPTRGLSPRQHIAYTCENHGRRTRACCYHDAPWRNQIPSRGVARMIGEWSASFDILPSARINEVMMGIAANGVAPYFDRELSLERKEFLRDYVEAQIVTFENGNIGTLSAWFYWTLKVEGGAFAEWSFLRGIDEGWIPPIPASNTSSESLFGSCEDILFRSSDNRTAIVEEFPDPTYLPPVTDPLKIIDDDVVISHGESLLHPDRYKNNEHDFMNRHYNYHWYHWLPLGLAFFALGIVAFREWMRSRKKAKYVQLGIGS
jgi:glucan 1,3-beta-glucosidase